MKFAGPEQAVRFAYRMSQQEILAKPSSGNMGGRDTSEEGLSPHDLHAQGAMILQALERLPSAERSAIKAFYAKGSERLEAIAEVVVSLLPLTVIPTKQAAFDSLHAWMKGDFNSSVHKVARDHYVSFRQARKWRDAIASAYMKPYLRAVGMLDEALFREGGLEKK